MRRRETIRTVARELGLGAMLLVVAGPSVATGQDLARAAQQFKLCTACHGANGQGDEQRHAPVIGGLPAWYVEGQLDKFRQGQRGYKANDDTALQMRPMAISLTTEPDVKAMAAYVASLHPGHPAPTIKGDPERGKTLYATCLACHGPEGKGNEALKAPPLWNQADWYIVAQLKKFRSGERGTGKGDISGTQMRAMVATLPNDQAFDDVAAYIRTLGK
jgi:cytochrome c oxidase subunit 2